MGYKRLHPNGLVRVHVDEPKPLLRVKPDATSGFRRYSFVAAVLALDPSGKLGLVSSDFQVIMSNSVFIVNYYWFHSLLK